MTPIASYTFLPWLRQGIANKITAADLDPTVHTRASVKVELELTGVPVGGGQPITAPVAHDVALYGPGDIVGIDPRVVVRTEPRDGITNFEGNYLAAVDFYDEDFPWRYTPAAPNGTRLRPWICLLVLPEDEFMDGKDLYDRPSPYIAVTGTSAFPPADELWAWAHVHVNALLSSGPAQLVADDMNAVLPKLQTLLAKDSDAAYARLLCPRHLADNTRYHAFVIPTFETGRLAGLGLDPGGAPHATFSAWAAYGGRPEPANHPVYFRWSFRTGSHGDFEYLVRLLKPQPIDTRVGTRNMDVQKPGSNIPGITKPELDGVLRLGGALRVPDASLSAKDLALRQTYEKWDQPYPDAFQQALAAFVNLPDDYATQTAEAANAASGLVDPDPDPLITAPLYGQWHALTRRLLVERDGSAAPNPQNWLHRLNLDPRYRVPAAFGTRVVQVNAENFMDDAWQQIGDVLAANAAIRRLQLAMAVATLWHRRHVIPLAQTRPERAFGLLALVSRRVLVDGVTVAHARSGSLVPPALTSTAMRRVVRPGGRLMRALPFDGRARPGNLLERVNAGEVTPARPKTVPPGLPTVDRAAAAATAGVPAWSASVLLRARRMPSLLLLGALVAVVLAVITFPVAPAGAVVLLAIAVLLVSLWWLSRRWRIGLNRQRIATEAGHSPRAVDELPRSPNFVLSTPRSPATVRIGRSESPTATRFKAAVRIGRSDSPTATRFKAAVRDAYTLLEASRTIGARPAPTRLDLPQLTALTVAAVDPTVTIPRLGRRLVSIPGWVLAQLAEDFVEVMAYPKIDLPMYEPLKKISVELFLPNINLIAANSITLIETNQRFIEAYMVGLNHEFARELLWREYPTDQRGSYFRQFWDVGSYIDPEGLSDNPDKEKLYDIPELHHWSRYSGLGAHNHRAAPGHTGQEQAVLVIRGELLKKYPNAMIYAHKAKWVKKDGKIDLTVPRDLVGLTAAEEEKPPQTKIRSPLYEAKADPDIYFFGFDLTVPEAQGGDGKDPNDDPGWFFIIKERPGEPRFGLDDVREGVLDVFSELTWNDAMPGAIPGGFLPANSLASPQLVPPSPPQADRQKQQDDDKQVAAAGASSARWAYLLFRPPVLVAVHAAEMLRHGGST